MEFQRSDIAKKITCKNKLNDTESLRILFQHSDAEDTAKHASKYETQQPTLKTLFAFGNQNAKHAKSLSMALILHQDNAK